MIKFNTILLSRTDGIGDVVLSLPVAHALKKLNPSCKILFLGNSSTRPLVQACENIDKFLDWTQIRQQNKEDQAGLIRACKIDVALHLFPRPEIARLAARAKIPLRVGTMSRLYHWTTCNRLMYLKRKNSGLHESLLNLKLLKGIGDNSRYGLGGIKDRYGLTRLPRLAPGLEALLSKDRPNVVLHPRSRGSAREWGLDNFTKLISFLPPDRFCIFVTGSPQERPSLEEFLTVHSGKITDLVGKCSLDQLIAFIARADALVAVSTGPLHIAAALGIRAIGIYAPKKSISPRRWGPLGANASHLVITKSCGKCTSTGDCECIRAVTPAQVADQISAIPVR